MVEGFFVICSSYVIERRRGGGVPEPYFFLYIGIYISHSSLIVPPTFGTSKVSKSKGLEYDTVPKVGGWRD